MSRKLIYDELIQKVNKLEKEIDTFKSKEETVTRSKQRYEELVQLLPESIYEMDVNGQLTFANRKALSHFGYTQEDFDKGLNGFDAISPLDRDRARENMRKVLQGEEIGLSEYTALRKDGSTFPILLHAAPILHNGKPIGARGFIVDITEKKHAEEMLRKSRENYQQLYQLMRMISDNVPDLLWAKDMNDEFIFINQAMCRKLLKCRTYDEAIGKTDMYFAEKERKAGYQHTFGEICVNSDEITKERKAPGRFLEDGLVRNEYLLLDVHKAPLLNENGDMVGTVGCGRDITKEAEVEKALQQESLRNESILQTAMDAFYITDIEGKILKLNHAASMISGYSELEMIGRNIRDLEHPEIHSPKKHYVNLAGEKGSHRFETRHVRKDGRTIDLEGSANSIQIGEENYLFFFLKDITERKEAERAIREREKELELQNANLEDLNAALRVLLKKREDDKKNLEANVLSNTKELIEPYLQKCKESGLNNKQQALISVCETNLREIVSPFSRTLSSSYSRLTSAEIEVANFVKQGKSSKEIAALLNLSGKTIESYRKNIRKKLGLTNQKANLRTHLLSLQ